MALPWQASTSTGGRATLVPDGGGVWPEPPGACQRIEIHAVRFSHDDAAVVRIRPRKQLPECRHRHPVGVPVVVGRDPDRPWHTGFVAAGGPQSQPRRAKPIPKHTTEKRTATPAMSSQSRTSGSVRHQKKYNHHALASLRGGNVGHEGWCCDTRHDGAAASQPDQRPPKSTAGLRGLRRERYSNILVNGNGYSPRPACPSTSRMTRPQHW